MSEKTFRAEYPPDRLGKRVAALARATEEVPPSEDPEHGSWTRWQALTVPGRLGAGPDPAPWYFMAQSRYDRYESGASGLVVMVLNEELIATGKFLFQQFFISFLDCEREPKESDPMKVFDHYARRRFVRPEMWIFEPAEAIVVETLRYLQPAWNRFHSPSSSPAFTMQAGFWVQPRFGTLGATSTLITER